MGKTELPVKIPHPTRSKYLKVGKFGYSRCLLFKFSNIIISFLILSHNRVLFYFLNETNINKSVENSELLFTMSKFENNVSINTNCPRNNSRITISKVVPVWEFPKMTSREFPGISRFFGKTRAGNGKKHIEIFAPKL